MWHGRSKVRSGIELEVSLSGVFRKRVRPTNLSSYMLGVDFVPDADPEKKVVSQVKVVNDQVGRLPCSIVVDGDLVLILLICTGLRSSRSRLTSPKPISSDDQ